MLKLTVPLQTQGVTKDDLEADPDLAEQRANVGEAAMYDIFYDDTEYDYMQHLRPTGQQPEAILIEAPGRRAKSKAASDEPTVDLPPGVLPTPASHTLSYREHLETAGQANSARPDGSLNPDMDLGLREILEALEDEEFVQADADDEFFDGLISTGQRDASEPEPRWSISESTWETQVAAVKSGASAIRSSDGSEGEDDLPDLPTFAGRAPPHGRAGSSFSMTSSSVYRNDGLSTLDDRFDQVRFGRSLMAANELTMRTLAGREGIRAEHR